MMGDLASLRRRHRMIVALLSELMRNASMLGQQLRQVEHNLEVLAGRFNQLFGEQRRPTLSVLYDGRDLLIDGQALCVDAAVHERAMEVMAQLARLEVHELQFEAMLTPYDLQRFLVYYLRQLPLTGIEQTLSPRIRVRSKEASLLMALDETLEPQELCARTCATALVVMSSFYEGIQKRDLSSMLYVKRVAQNLVVLGERYPRLLLAILGAAPERSDSAALAVKGAVLSVMTLRRITRDLRNVTDLAVAALLFDVGLARRAHLSALGEEHVASGSEAVDGAAMTTLLGELGESSLARSIYLHEALSLTLHPERALGYEDPLPATIEAQVLSASRRFIAHLVASPGEVAPPQDTHHSGESAARMSRVDQAISALEVAARTHSERLVAALVLSGLGLFPRASRVELSSGHKALVLANHERPSCFSRPVVRLLRDERGEPLKAPLDVDLSLPQQEALGLGCVTGRVSGADAVLDAAREALLRPVERPAPQPRLLEALKRRKRQEPATPEPPPPPPPHQPALRAPLEEAPAALVFDDTTTQINTQIRKAPQLFEGGEAPSPLLESLLEVEAPEIDPFEAIPVASTFPATPGMLSWDEADDTAHSLPSDRIQMLRVSDIAHMVPEELSEAHSVERPPLIDNDFSVAPFLKPQKPATPEADITHDELTRPVTSVSSIVPLEGLDLFGNSATASHSAPLSLQQETWDDLHEQLHEPSASLSLDESGSQTAPSDNLLVLSASVHVRELGSSPSEEEVVATSLLPPEVVDAFVFHDRSRRRQEARDAQSEVSEEEDEDATQQNLPRQLE